MISTHVQPTSPVSPESTPTSSGPLAYDGPPRVLEIDYGDGSWCFRLKKEQPGWIVEGIDDTDHLSRKVLRIDANRVELILQVEMCVC